MQDLFFIKCYFIKKFRFAKLSIFRFIFLYILPIKQKAFLSFIKMIKTAFFMFTCSYGLTKVKCRIKCVLVLLVLEVLICLLLFLFLLPKVLRLSLILSPISDHNLYVLYNILVQALYLPELIHLFL